MKILILLFLFIIEAKAAPHFLLDQTDPAEVSHLKTQLLNPQSIQSQHLKFMKSYVEDQADFSQSAIEAAESTSLTTRLILEISMNQKALNLATLLYFKSLGVNVSWPMNYSEIGAKALIRERLLKFKDSLSRSNYLLSIDSSAINIQMILLIDLAKALNTIGPTEIGQVENKISNLTSDLRENYRLLRPTEKNNHSLRTASAIGLGGLYFNNQNWIDIALDSFSTFSIPASAWTYQTSYGAYAEGMNYFTYATDLLLPFIYYYEKIKNKNSLSSSFHVRKVFEWSLHSAMPDGLRPPIDNGNISPDPSSAYFFDKNTYPSYITQTMEWDYQKSLPWYSSFHQVILLFKNLKLNRQLRNSPHSSYGNYVNPTLGTVFLRTGSTMNDDYLMIIGENGEARSHGGAHESVDNGAYLFWSHGEAITIQPGYFGFKRVSETNKAYHHSIPLVNGEGPASPIQVIGWMERGEDAFINLIAKDSYRVQSQYHHTNISRLFKHYPKGILKITDDFSRSWLWGKADMSSPIHLNAGRSAENQVISINGNQCFRTLKLKKFACIAFYSPQGINLSSKASNDMFTGLEKVHTTLIPQHHARISTITTIIAVAENSFPEITYSQGKIHVSQDGVLVELN